MKKILFSILSGFLIAVCFAGTGNYAIHNISGTVVDATTKKPLAEVTIVAQHAATKGEHVITTDVNGSYTVSDLPEGTYKIKFLKDDYCSEKRTVNVKAQHTTRLNVKLFAEAVEINNRRSWWDKFDIFL